MLGMCLIFSTENISKDQTKGKQMLFNLMMLLVLEDTQVRYHPRSYPDIQKFQLLIYKCYQVNIDLSFHESLCPV